jgi:hypothetical protein
MNLPDPVTPAGSAGRVAAFKPGAPYPDLGRESDLGELDAPLAGGGAEVRTRAWHGRRSPTARRSADRPAARVSVRVRPVGHAPPAAARFRHRLASTRRRQTANACTPAAILPPAPGGNRHSAKTAVNRPVMLEQCS